ncbi:SRPBCC domain-containing protein [Fodinicola acaciae]|uniref:SRPBCC domain-containing protein n=1 Tax=Fodinicola acaciae TaxID=2681555 RepID=UPI0013D5A22F|nr:SRPBCC domain-containing protein [Fodinicola acaciae]
MDDAIEQTITIEAGLDRVWELVTEPGWWVPSDGAVVSTRAAGERVVRESAQWGRFIVEVARIRPRSYVAFRWASAFPGAEPVPGRSTLVEFFVTERPGGVEVRLVESGFTALDLPAQGRGSAREGNVGGWREQLAGLAARARA